MVESIEATRLLPTLQAITPPCYRVALSGGLDSTVLLHLLVTLRDAGIDLPVAALHIHHGLQAEAEAWLTWCQQLCDRWRVDLAVHRVVVKPQGEGVEAAARTARYAIFKEYAARGEAILLAHHRDDQAETLINHLLRGSGVRGLAAMPVCRTLAAGSVVRPLLPFSRQAIAAWAQAHHLEWIEDPSNGDLSLRRNFLRHRVMPLLRETFGDVTLPVARSALWCSEADELLQGLATADLTQVVAATTPAWPWLCHQPLQCSRLSQLSNARQRNLLRYWLIALNLPLPDHRRLNEVLSQLVVARHDSAAEVHWRGVEIHRYRDQLHAFTPLPPLPEVRVALKDGAVTPLPDGYGVILPGSGGGAVGEGASVIWSPSTERVALAIGRHRLKRIWQKHGVPPWLRLRWPLIVDRHDALIALPGLWCATSSPALMADAWQWRAL
jgi:tRNA(Ile)-lysidine synthase